GAAHGSGVLRRPPGGRRRAGVRRGRRGDHRTGMSAAMRAEPEDVARLGPATLHRLNWGCGPHPPTGWINSDLLHAPGVHLACDIRNGLPVPSNIFHYIVSIHALEQIPFLDVRTVLGELRR